MTEITNTFNEYQLKWIEALKSGKYEQGKTKLCYNDKYCCLGVAAMLFMDNEDVRVMSSGICTFNGYENYIPEDLKEQLCLYDVSGMNYDTNKPPLTELNDIHNKTFLEIAEILEKNPGEYFANFTPPKNW